jgi:hypothetical protein
MNIAPRQAEEQNRCLAKQKKYLSVPASLKVQTNQQDTKYPKLLSGLTYLAQHLFWTVDRMKDTLILSDR